MNKKSELKLDFHSFSNNILKTMCFGVMIINGVCEKFKYQNCTESYGAKIFNNSHNELLTFESTYVQISFGQSFFF